MGDVGAKKKNGVQENQSVITNPDPSTISNGVWAAAEEAVQEVIKCIHPNLGSVEKRNDVIDYMQSLFKSTLGFEVLPFGSVPLKTYLPDGDIDLTVLGNPSIANSWYTGVLSVLQQEEHNEYAEYEVKDTQFIDAVVKVVKCIVKNIVIDISFNQLGGISTLCFLEKVDRLVGKDHLFKRSIILIKSWCYYESRILASNHGLLSTYAVESLVLCIFQMFHTSLDTPVAVLYRFLDYYGKFDWEKYGISVNGPFRKSSLPDIVVEMPENNGINLLLDEEFFKNCIDNFVILSTESVSNIGVFQLKHLNIIDPIRDNNNLGRSVHKGNFYRIRSALRYGARKLGGILSSPKESFTEELKKFFSSSLQRHAYKTMWETQLLLEDSGTVYDNNGTFCNPCSVSMANEYPLCLEDNLDNLSLELKDNEKSGVVDLEPLDPLADLTGDLESHIRGLSYWKCCHELSSLASASAAAAAAASMASVSPVLSPCQFPLTNAWEPFYPQSYPYNNNRPGSYSFPNSSPPVFMEPPSFYPPHEGNWNNHGSGLMPHFPSNNPLNRDNRPFSGNKGLGSWVQPRVETSYTNGGYVRGFVVTTSSSWKATTPSVASKPPIPCQVYRKTGGTVVSQSSNNLIKEEDGDGRTSTRGNLTKPSSQVDFGSLVNVEVMISGSTDSVGALTSSNMVVVAPDKGPAVAAASSTAKDKREEDGVFYLKEEDFPALSVGRIGHR